MCESQEEGREEAALPVEELDRVLTFEETVGDLKKEKASLKTAFTKARRYLQTLIQREDADTDQIQGICKELDIALKKCYEGNGEVV